jgi:hypothetical protein
MAAGCTPDIDEENYREYSTYFWAALYGKARTGQTVQRPDYDGDGKVTLAEAHAYVQITSDTIDIPLATSDIFLRSCSKIGSKDKPDLVSAEMDVEELLESATPGQKAVIEQLSAQLKLTDDGRMVEAKALADKIDKERKAIDRRRVQRELGQMRGQIQSAVKRKWPELANPWHPRTLEIMQKESDEVIRVIEKHPRYQRFEELSNELDGLETRNRDLERKWVKCQRVMQTLTSLAYAANFENVASEELKERYKELVEAENCVIEKR